MNRFHLIMKTGYFSNIRNFLFDNLNPRQTILKNTFWLTVGTFSNKLLMLALIIYAARIFEATEYGKFTFAIAFVSLLMIFSDLGLSKIITREFAREKGKREEFYSIISLKILLAFGTFILILLSSFFITPEKDIQKIILILAFFLLANNFIGAFYSFFHARQKMEYEAWLEILQVLLLFSFGFFVLFKLPSAVNLSYAYSISALFALIFVLIFFHYKIFSLKIRWNFSVWKKFLSMSWPLALIGLSGLIYSYIDSIMMGYWNMLAEVGWYNAAQRVSTAALLPMGFIAASFYPALSKFSKESEEKFQKEWHHLLEVMIMIAFPLVVGGIFLAQKIIYSLYPSGFNSAVLAFQILIFTAGIIFIYRPFYDAMIILNQQAKIFWITIAGAVMNVALNLILIPRYSLYGAAVATVITNFLILLVMVFFLKKFTPIKLYNSKIFLTLLISVISATLMYSVIKQPFIYNINIFLLVPIGTAVYLIFLLMFRKYIFGYLKYANT